MSQSGGTFDTPSQAATRTPSSRPTSTRSTASLHRSSSRTSDESTPLLARQNSSESLEGGRSGHRSPAASSLRRSLTGGSEQLKKRRPWPIIVALLLLCIFTVAIMLLGFFVPDAVEEYAMQAKELEITSISLPEFTATGARARIQGIFWLDAAKVQKKPIRNLGRFGTWVAREVSTGESKVEVTLPDYGDVLLGTAVVPPVKVNVRNGNKNIIDILADLEPGDVDGIRRIADDWLDGRLDGLRVRGKADVKIRSGLLSLPTQTIEQILAFNSDQIPAIPAYNISKLNIHEVDFDDSSQGMEAAASVRVKNNYPVDFVVPPLGFAILVDNCLPTDPRIMLADATLGDLHIKPHEDIFANVSGIVKQLPDSLTSACPGSDKSPLDALLGGYMKGKDTTVYVTGSPSPSPGTPKWITDLASSITVPVPFPGRGLGNLIRNFSLSDVHFSLPDPLAEPDTPESEPTVSAGINALVALPEEMNFEIDVDQVRADADVYYKGQKLGRLDLHKWQKANSSRIEPHGKESQPTLLVHSVVKNAPLHITDDDLFTDVVQALLFGGKTVMLAIKADVDVQVKTALGALTVRQVPAEGVVPINPLGAGKGLKSFSPKIGNLLILETSGDALVLQAELNFTNPTPYAATVPYVDINILTNGTILGHATARDVVVKPGVNQGLITQATWKPLSEEGRTVGRELLSQYISGHNTTLTLQTHKNSFPAQPALGKALESISFTIPTPRLGGSDDSDGGDDGGDGDDKDPADDKPHFIKDATMHLFSSTATFTLLSPLSHTSLFITHINATALYKGSEVGNIFYGQEFSGLPDEFEVSPGLSTSPRLPVDWNLGSVGYEAIRKALGGTLRLSAQATVGIRIGEWRERVWYKGGGIGAHVRV